MHYYVSHFDPYHAVQLKSLAEQYCTSNDKTVNRRDSDRSQTAYCVTVCFLRLLISMFLFDVLVIIARNTLKSDYKITIGFPEEAYNLLM